MRVALAIVFNVICSAAQAQQTPETSVSAAPFSIGRPHVCSSYYPPEAMKANIEGTVLVGFMVKVSGSVSDIKVLKSSGNKDLDDAAVTCVTHWRYKPAIDNGAPIEMPWQANVVWKIAPAPEVEAARFCMLKTDPSRLPASPGHTIVNFHVMQDGSVSDVRVLHSSGYQEWDDVGVACAQARRYNMSAFKLPSEGLPSQMAMDWAGALASIPPAPVPPAAAATGTK
jgi:TonB family protein